MRPWRARLAWFGVNCSGDCSDRRSATHRVKALSASQLSLGVNGATTCRPLPPVDFDKTLKSDPAERVAHDGCSLAHARPWQALVGVGVGVEGDDAVAVVLDLMQPLGTGRHLRSERGFLLASKRQGR